MGRIIRNFLKLYTSSTHLVMEGIEEGLELMVSQEENEALMGMQEEIEIKDTVWNLHALKILLQMVIQGFSTKNTRIW